MLHCVHLHSLADSKRMVKEVVVPSSFWRGMNCIASVGRELPLYLLQYISLAQPNRISHVVLSFTFCVHTKNEIPGF
jgi:hypothetical protein